MKPKKRVRKMRTKAMLVRTEQMRNIKLINATIHFRSARSSLCCHHGLFLPRSSHQRLQAQRNAISGARGERTHKQQKKSKTSIESRTGQPQRISWVALGQCLLGGIGHIGAIGIEPGDEGESQGTPEGAVGSEDDEGEGVADNPLADSRQDHEDGTEDDEDACGFKKGQRMLGEGRKRESRPVDAAPTPPAPRQPIRSMERGVKQRRKPTKALSPADSGS